jgi:hypothetical protein
LVTLVWLGSWAFEVVFQVSRGGTLYTTGI